MKHPDYPGVSDMTTRHGKIRWRLRRSGKKDVMLPGEPHTAEFDEAYNNAILGRPAPVVQMPGSASPKSLKAAYRLLKKTDEWLALDDKSSTRYQQTIERILSMPAGGKTVLGDGPVGDLKRSHVKSILSAFRDTPHMERIVLICLRKLIMVAIDEEWIEVDPTYKMTRNPQTDGHKAWPLEIMAKYEARWEVGTRQRTAYALALWLGNRVSDITRLRWDHQTTKHIAADGEIHAVDGFEFVQFKGRKRGKKLFLPMTPMLDRELAPLARDQEKTVLLSSRDKPYTDGSLSTAMADWCREAGIAPGYTMHGLRKALGVKLAESDASTRQLMEMLGHKNIAYAELYSREASQTRLAVQAMEKVTKIEEARRRPKISAVE
ncbi:tyrosine-type recombinase/integrase [Mesorhizobium sp.]|uniref:tyrosine-type recombinase/integrase n=1 Tax=Mesorhizobium sp. TaxID=1871066 RepID=UPI00257EF2A4|nr:tyrosine-type recombinase/integrase [Mesorhizobium sp.]